MENMETPEGKLIGDATRAARKSVRKVADEAGISEGRWRQIVKGYQSVSAGTVIPVKAPAGTLAKMAQAVGVTPEQLIEVGRADAAQALAADLTFEPGDYQWGEQAIRTRVGALAKQRREELGLSRDAMALRAGFQGKQSVMNFEFAKSMPRGENLRAIERALEWKFGSINEALESGKRAGDLAMEDFDAFDRTPKMRPLSGFSTEALLEEVIYRLDSIKGALGPSRTMAAPADFGPANLYGLAANTDPSHLERIAEEDAARKGPEGEE